MDSLLEQLHDPQDWRVRKAAVQSLADLGTAEAMQSVLTALYDESPHVVQQACHLLPKFGAAAIPGMLEALHSPREIASRRFIIHALDDIGDQGIAPDLLPYLDHSDDGLRYAATLYFAKIPDARAVPSLIGRLEDNLYSIRAESAKALARLRAVDAIPNLTRVLVEDEEQYPRRMAAAALGLIDTEASREALLSASHHQDREIRYTSTEGLAYSKSPQALQRLIEMLNDEDQTVRWYATHNLGRPGNSEAVSYLLRVMDDTNPDARNLPLTALGNTGDLRVLPTLMKHYRRDPMGQGGQALYEFAISFWHYKEDKERAVEDALETLGSHDDPWMRASAVWLLYVFNCELWEILRRWAEAGKKRDDFREPPEHTPVMEALIGALDDTNPDVQLSVMEPLIRTGDHRAVPSLLRRLADQDPLVVRKAIDTLGSIRDVRAVPYLTRIAAHTSDESLLRTCILALGAIGDEQSVDQLIQFLQHRNPSIRGLAAHSLGRKDHVRAVPPLLEMLRAETNFDALESAIAAFWALKDSRAVPELMRILTKLGDNPNDTYELRYRAAIALSYIADEAALPAVFEAIDKAPEWQVRKYAVEAVGNIGEPRGAADRLFRLLEHEDDTVRTAAATRLGYMGAETPDLDLRDHIVTNLISRLQDTGLGYHAMPYVADAAAKSLYYVGTTEAIQALKSWELKKPGDSSEQTSESQ